MKFPYKLFKVSSGKIKAYIQLFEGILKSQRDRSFIPFSINPDLLEMIRSFSIFIPLGQILSCKSTIGYKSTELKFGNQNLATFFMPFFLYSIFRGLNLLNPFAKYLLKVKETRKISL